jgi:hypothetical protein
MQRLALSSETYSNEAKRLKRGLGQGSASPLFRWQWNRFLDFRWKCLVKVRRFKKSNRNPDRRLTEQLQPRAEHLSFHQESLALPLSIWSSPALHGSTKGSRPTHQVFAYFTFGRMRGTQALPSAMR